MISDILHEMTQINHLLLDHMLKPAQANKAADIIPVENDVKCPQSTHRLAPGIFFLIRLAVGLFLTSALHIYF